MISLTIATRSLAPGESTTCALCGSPLTSKLDECEGRIFCPYATCAVEYASRPQGEREDIARGPQ